MTDTDSGITKPDARRTRLTANGITIELDLVEVMEAIDPQGSYTGYDPERDEEMYVSDSLSSMLVHATATLLAKATRKQIVDDVAVAVRDAIDAEVAQIVRDTLDGPVQKVSAWGAPQGDATSLRDLIGKAAEDALRKPELRDGYSRGSQPTMVQRIIAKEVEAAFKKEIQGHVKEAQAAAVSAVKASAAEVIGETIDRARRGLA